MNPGFNSNKREPPVRCRVRHTAKKKEENSLKNRHFGCWCASSNTSPIFFKSTSKLTPPWHLTYLIWTSASHNKTIDSAPEIITSSDVIWRHVCINIKNTDDSQVTWLGHVTDVILGANAVLFIFSLAPESTNISIYSGLNLSFERGAFPAQIRCATIREVTPPIFQKQQIESSAVLLERYR